MKKALGISYKEYSSQVVTKGKYRLSRFADDFLIFAKTKEDIEKCSKTIRRLFERKGFNIV